MLAMRATKDTFRQFVISLVVLMVFDPEHHRWSRNSLSYYRCFNITPLPGASSSVSI